MKRGWRQNLKDKWLSKMKRKYICNIPKHMQHNECSSMRKVHSIKLKKMKIFYTSSLKTQLKTQAQKKKSYPKGVDSMI